MTETAQKQVLAQIDYSLVFMFSKSLAYFQTQHKTKQSILKDIIKSW